MKIDKKKLKDEIDAVSEKWDTSGSYIVLNQEEILHHGIYGYADRENQIKMQNESRYTFHAVDHFLMGMCLLILADQGKVKLSDPMSKWIPEYKHADQIKIEYLLRQSSGIPDYFYDGLMVDLENDEQHQALDDKEKMRLEGKIIYQNRNFSDMMTIIKDRPLAYEPGTPEKEDSESETVFISEIVKRITKDSLFNTLKKYIFDPLQMDGVSQDLKDAAISYKVYRDVEFVSCPLNFQLDETFTLKASDCIKLLKALLDKKLLSDKMWKKALKYNKEGRGMFFHNANGFDCGSFEFMANQFMFYFSQDKKIAFASLSNQDLLMKFLENSWHYYRRDAREVVEAMMTYPEQTKLVKLSKSNFWDAMNLSVAEEQQEFVLDAKASVAMALMYPTKRGFAQMEGNRVVGLLVVDVDHKNSYYNIDIIIIDKKYQGRGYGKHMLNWAVDYLKNEGAKTLKIGVSRYNHGAKKIYLSAGFVAKSVYDKGMTLQLDF